MREGDGKGGGRSRVAHTAGNDPRPERRTDRPRGGQLSYSTCSRRLAAEGGPGPRQAWSPGQVPAPLAAPTPTVSAWISIELLDVRTPAPAWQASVCDVPLHASIKA